MMSGMTYSELLPGCMVSEYALPYKMGNRSRFSSFYWCILVFTLITAQERSLDWRIPVP